MRPTIARLWLAAALACTALPGCQWGSGSHTYPADPLFVGRKPVEVKAKSAGPVLAAHAEPATPRLPTAIRAKVTTEEITPGMRPPE